MYSNAALSTYWLYDLDKLVGKIWTQTDFATYNPVTQRQSKEDTGDSKGKEKAHKRLLNETLQHYGHISTLWDYCSI